MTKPDFPSVTEQPCTCGFLEREADNPASPILFDKQLGEYHLVYQNSQTGGTIIYHCPFCGGAAPPSKREALFTAIPDEEAQRLYQLFDGMRTLQEVIAALGPPDKEEKRGLTVGQHEEDGQAPTMRSFRTLRYTHLSDSADVVVHAAADEGGLGLILMGKYIGSGSE